MANEVEVKITGLDEIQKALEELPRQVARQIVRRTLREAGNIVKKKMVELVPRDSGLLSKHFKVSTKLLGKKTDGDIGGRVFVGPDKSEHVENPGSKK